MLVVYAAAALAVALIGARYMKAVAHEPASGARGATGTVPEWRSQGRAGASGDGASGGSGAELDRFRAIVVHVTGAVRRPGVVRLRDGDRVGDAIESAGGPSRRADLGAVNLALRLADGQQVVVPVRGAAGVAAGSVGAGAAAGADASGPVSLNGATVEQLQTLDGIGPGLAAKIVAYREQNGGFRSIDELGEVPGIGEKRLEALRGRLQP